MCAVCDVPTTQPGVCEDTLSSTNVVMPVVGGGECSTSTDGSSAWAVVRMCGLALRELGTVLHAQCPWWREKPERRPLEQSSTLLKKKKESRVRPGDCLIDRHPAIWEANRADWVPLEHCPSATEEVGAAQPKKRWLPGDRWNEVFVPARHEDGHGKAWNCIENCWSHVLRSVRKIT